MSQESTGAERRLVALIRADGRGELRDGATVLRMRAGGADELRGLVMEKAMSIAAEAGVDVRVRTVDVDGVYPLVLSPTGGIDQDGEIEPLRPEDVELTPEDAPDDADDADDADEGTGDEWLHETIRLPRLGMMAPMPPAPEAAPELPERPVAAPAVDAPSDQAADDADAERGEGEPDTDLVPIVSDLFGDGSGDDEADADLDDTHVLDGDEALDDRAALDDEDDDSVVDEFHDEALDHDFDDDDDDAEDADGRDGADEPADDGTALDDADADDGVDERADERADPLLAARAAAAEAAAAQAAPRESDDAEWRPAFARDPERARGRIGLGAEPERGPGFPEVPLFPDLDDPDPSASREPAPGAPSPDDGRDPAPRAARPAAGLPPRRRDDGAPAGTGPTLDDFFAVSGKQAKPVAEQGWRANLRRASGGLISLGPGARERAEQRELDTIRRPFDGPRTIVVVNPKGGAHKTTATLMIAAMFGIHRGGYTLAWDNNETRGTLGWRSKPGATTNTAVDLLRELPRFEISGGASIADVDRFVRNQGYAKFDVLASDDDAASAAIIDDDAFSRLHRVLSRFYRVMVIDTGNNMRASNWEAALEAADQLVIVSTAREDTAASAAWLADGLRERGYGDKLANAVTILSSPSEKDDAQLAGKLERHFAQLTRAVVSVPYDHAFVGGGELDVPSLQPATREAWRHAASVIAEGL
ncbi:MAG: hypothetical protein GXX90_03465 [Microbacteriaceae bacterium]|nr:hypothetical protein [Microbacteriaceae bacterium]